MIAVLGRQPALGIAELERIFGADAVRPYGEKACLVAVAPERVNFSRLGGSVRFARILKQFQTASWQEIRDYLMRSAPEHAEYIDGKLVFGLSVYGFQISAKKLAATALELKKQIKKAGHSVRMVPHTQTELGSATVLYNKLTGPNGWELLLVSNGTTAYLAQTVHIQDIDAYAARDQQRPFRDAKVGMLPPKLAQIIINLAAGDITQSRPLLLDPFCGTGVVLQEAMLMDFDIYGTDLEPRMVQYSIDNLSWLDSRYPDVGDYRRIEIGDATTHRWHNPEKITIVAGETFLGKPLSALPPSDQLSKIMHEVNAIHHKFLKNLSTQITKGTRLCLAVPAWRGKHQFLHLSALDYLEDLGYTRVRFKHVEDKDLIYHREGQVVGRELLVLEKR